MQAAEQASCGRSPKRVEPGQHTHNYMTARGDMLWDGASPDTERMLLLAVSPQADNGAQHTFT